MNYLLVFFILSIFGNSNFEKGCRGEYYIKGIAFDHNHKPMTNKILRVKSGENTKEVQSDKYGGFEIGIIWKSFCEGEEIDKFNPEFIIITCDNKKIKLENKWKKYAKCFPDSKENITWQKNLNFD